MIVKKYYDQTKLNIDEALRYAGVKSADSAAEALLRECYDLAKDHIDCKVCYIREKVAISDDTVNFEHFSVKSKALSNLLKNCGEAVIFAATIGIGVDRLSAKYGHISPSVALMMQALGAERIESLCDEFCRDFESNECDSLVLTSRFSPGYGDLPLSTQKKIFDLLDCPRQLGITLNDSLIMSPTKSVTAIMGLCREDQKCKHNNKCADCDNVNCAFRS